MKNLWILIACFVLSVSAVGCGPDTSVVEPENTAPAPTTDESGNAGQAEESQTATVPGS